VTDHARETTFTIEAYSKARAIALAKKLLKALYPRRKIIPYDVRKGTAK
jgi:hypothetical protein